MNQTHHQGKKGFSPVKYDYIFVIKKKKVIADWLGGWELRRGGRCTSVSTEESQTAIEGVRTTHHFIFKIGDGIWLKKIKLMNENEKETLTAKREPASLRQVDCHGRWRKPWQMENKMKPRGGSIEDTKKGRSRHTWRWTRRIAAGEDALQLVVAGEDALDWSPPLQVGFPFGVFLPISVCLQSGLGFYFRDQLGLFF